MDDVDTIYANAREGRPFSNGTDWEIWSYNNCENGCVHDAAYQRGETNEGCPLVLVAMLDRTPREWIPGPDEYCGDKYACVFYRHEDEDDPDATPQPVPDPDGMEALFPREICEGPRVFLPMPEVPARDLQTAVAL
jgi:hypothetical protein